MSTFQPFESMPQRPPFQPLEHHVRPITFAITAVGIIAAVDVLFGLSWLGTLSNYGPDTVEKARQLSLERSSGALGLARVMAVMAAAVFFLRWFVSAYTNLMSFSRTPTLRYTPRQVAWAFFLPIINYVRPYRAMVEIWQGSDVQAAEAGTASRPPGIILAWWLTWMGSGILSNIAFPIAIDEPSVRGLRGVAWLELGADLLTITAAVIIITIVKIITAEQHAMKRPPQVADLYG